MRLRLQHRARRGRANYRTILVSDAVAEASRETHEGELKTMSRVFADVKTTDEVLEMLGR